VGIDPARQDQHPGSRNLLPPFQLGANFHDLAIRDSYISPDNAISGNQRPFSDDKVVHRYGIPIQQGIAVKVVNRNL
jgi:hypothetical protein